LPDQFEYRLGLSATPSRWYDEIGTQGILNYFGEIIFEFPLGKAIQEGYLTPYYYFPKIVELTEDETVNYEILTKKICALINIGEDPDNNEDILKLLIRRAEIIQQAENKIPTIIEILENIPNLSHSIFYCAPGQIDELTMVLGKEKHYRVHTFTYHENHNLRRELLHNFDAGIIQALLAIKCLDEGVDIPSTKTAFILASSSNPREFVQRRGRILRNYPNKKFAEIYDLIVSPPSDTINESNYEKSIIKRELQRFKEFADNSLNFNSSYDVIWNLSKIYGILDF
jgi:superfamily II DNA or RNA helicase